MFLLPLLSTHCPQFTEHLRFCWISLWAVGHALGRDEQDMSPSPEDLCGALAPAWSPADEQEQSRCTLRFLLL